MYIVHTHRKYYFDNAKHDIDILPFFKRADISPLFPWKKKIMVIKCSHSENDETLDTVLSQAESTLEFLWRSLRVITSSARFLMVYGVSMAWQRKSGAKIVRAAHPFLGMNFQLLILTITMGKETLKGGLTPPCLWPIKVMLLVNTPKVLNWSGSEKKAEKQIISSGASVGYFHSYLF